MLKADKGRGQFAPPAADIVALSLCPVTALLW